jgi:DNA-binding NtrC family response regulator
MLRGCRVLAVDSKADIASMYAVALRRTHAEFRVASSGRAALAHMASGWIPHVLVVDRGLRDMSAAALASAVNERAGVRVGLVCTTADARHQTREAARTEGFDECLVAPIHVDPLVAAIARAAKKGQWPTPLA